MRYFVLLAIVLIIFCPGCIKDDQGCSNVKPADEQTAIMGFALANGMTALRHQSGLYYQIIDPGAGVTPNINSKITVNYSGKYLNGVQFDKSAAPTPFLLRDMVEGWIIGIPLINKGGRIQLIIPSSMAYGCNGARVIPPNSVLFFDVDLVDVQ